MSLPVYASGKEIVGTVLCNRVTIISADTGAGKSTVVPGLLYEAGFRVMVTQPRRLAARTVAERVAQQMGVELGTLVGYRTAEDAKDSENTEILFCTDGLQLVHELRGRQGDKPRVLVIDEVHEWNVNQETLVAYCKHELKRDPNLRVVLMSATINDEELARHFDGAPVVKVPGKLHHVDKFHDPDSRMEDVIATLAHQGHHVLAFAEGKAEIQRLIDELKRMLPTIPILPLHGQMTGEEQRAAFLHYDGPLVVVATDVAQTSITIPGITAVVDSGRKKQTMVVDGVEGLYLTDISRADCMQRAGRAGRTGPGVYYLCSRLGLEMRREFSAPEIERVRLDQLVLRLAAFGLNAEELDFFHKPDLVAIRQARRSLRLLGALDDKGSVTSLGREMNRYPLSVQHARMLVEARRRGVEGPVATIVACLEVGGILLRPEKGMTPAWYSVTSQTSKRQSDLLAQLDAFRAVVELPARKFKDCGVAPKRLQAAKELIRRMARDMGLKVDHNKAYKPEAVMLACLSGYVENIYTGYGQQYTNAVESIGRKLNNDSVVSGSAGIVAGTPWDLQYEVTDRFSDEKYLVTRHLINGVSVVTLPQLKQLWPNLVRVVSAVHCLSGRRVVCRQTINFNGQVFVVESPATPGDEAARVLAEAVVNGAVDYPAKGDNQWIQHLQGLKLCEVPTKQLMATLTSKLGKVTSETELQELDLRLSKEDFLPEEIAAKLDFGPSTMTVDAVEIQVSYEIGFMGLTATLEIPVTAVGSLTDIPAPHADRVWFKACDDNGNVVVSDSTLRSLKIRLAEHQDRLDWWRKRDEEAAAQRAAEEECDKRLAAAAARVSTLKQQGLPVAPIEKRIDDLYYDWRHQGVRQLPMIAAIEGMIAKLETADPIKALLDDMIRRGSFDDLKRRTAIAAIRSNGFFETVTDEVIRAYCERRVEELGVTSVNQFHFHSNRIVPRLEDYVDQEMLRELGRQGDLAPTAIEVAGRKGSSLYDVTYAYDERDGKTVPVGRISLPLSVYERNAQEHGKPSMLPELPHGIVLVVEVTQDGKVIASGVDGPELQTKLKKHKKGQRRSSVSLPSLF